MPDPAGYREQATTPGRDALAALRARSEAERARGEAARVARAERRRVARKLAVGLAIALPILATVLLVLRMTVLPYGWVGLVAMCCFVLTVIPGLMAVGLRNPPDPNVHRTVSGVGGHRT